MLFSMLNLQRVSTLRESMLVSNVQKKRRMKSLVTKLRDRVASLQLKIEQLQIDNEALKYVGGSLSVEINGFGIKTA